MAAVTLLASRVDVNDVPKTATLRAGVVAATRALMPLGIALGIPSAAAPRPAPIFGIIPGWTRRSEEQA